VLFLYKVYFGNYEETYIVIPIPNSSDAINESTSRLGVHPCPPWLYPMTVVSKVDISYIGRIHVSRSESLRSACAYARKEKDKHSRCLHDVFTTVVSLVTEGGNKQRQTLSVEEIVVCFVVIS
jgi:hypothetical protein